MVLTNISYQPMGLLKSNRNEVRQKVKGLAYISILPEIKRFDRDRQVAVWLMRYVVAMVFGMDPHDVIDGT